MRNNWLVLLAFLVGSLVLQPAIAATHKPTTTDPNANDNKVITTVSSVDAANNKVTLTVADNKQDSTYTMALGSTVTIEGSPATLNQLSAGMVVLSYTEADETSLQQIDVSKSKAKAPATTSKKKK
jgi:hypothetical protein